ncbi:MAG: hypothetical protein LQ340_002067 [Diploschistes diacapsis]|nr:MAG: hypothetical protein LQ340_002067 [Diploschistes diacapsis]
MGTEDAVENMSMNDGENLGSQTTDIGHRTVYEGLLNTSVEDANNYVTYRTDYLNLADDSFIGSIIGSSSTDIYTSPLSTAPDVLEIVTTVMVTKASPAFFKKFKEENRIDTRIQQDFVVQGFEFGYVKKVEMIVHSQKLVDALRAIIEYYPGSSLFATDQVKINEPFAEILHYRDEIEAYKNHHPPTHSPDYIEATNQHIDILLLYIDQRYGKELEAERQRHRKSPPTCTYQMLWLLFKPGELCYYYPAVGQLQAIITKNLKTPLQIGEYVAGSTHLFGWSVSYGGKTFGREPFDKAISNFVGEKEIATLECYPARYFVQHGSITHAQMQERLIARGRKYWEMAKPTYSDYRGTTAYFPYRQV